MTNDTHSDSVYPYPEGFDLPPSCISIPYKSDCFWFDDTLLFYSDKSDAPMQGVKAESISCGVYWWSEDKVAPYKDNSVKSNLNIDFY